KGRLAFCRAGFWSMKTTIARPGSFSATQASRMSCGLMSERVSDVTEDAFLGGKLRLRQPKSGHRAGHDAILLAAATPACSGDRVVDLGAGVGAAGLALARRVAGLKLVLVEIDAALADLARGNAAANAISADVIVLDVTSDAAAFAAAGLAPDSVDVVLMNPPFNDPARHRASPDQARVSAHVASAATLESWIGASRRRLETRGTPSPIWRAGGAEARLRQPQNPAGSWRGRGAGDSRAGLRRQGRQGARSNPCRAAAQ